MRESVLALIIHALNKEPDMPKALGMALAVLMTTGGLATSGVAAAAPLAPLPVAKAPIVLAANGCGPGYFRTIDGECIPNQQIGGRHGRAPPPCPRGYLRDPDPARPLCYPIY